MILYVDLSTGASGDKLLGALLELCEAESLVGFDELARLAGELLPGVVFEREQVMRKGIRATHVTVTEHSLAIEHSAVPEHSEVSGHSQVSAHSAGHSLLSGSHEHRHWEEISELITGAATRNIVPTSTAELAIRVFTRVAEAEAKVHGVAPSEVHFHEVGAADSIIDILFSSLLLDLLSPAAVFATPLALGSGTVVCQHGELPVPAPATAEILAGTKVPVYASSHAGELTTPTGAALVAEFVTSFAPLPCSSPVAIGYGAGSRELPGAANVLRIISARPAPLAGLETLVDEQLFVEGVVLLECTLDHLSPEALAFACEELLALEGTLDVWQESVTMKKGRLAVKLLVLTRQEFATGLAKKVIELTGSLGVRSQYLERTVIPRSVVRLDTPYGPVPFKAAELGTPDSRTHWLRPEHEAVAQLARKTGLSYPDLYAQLLEHAQPHR